HRRRRGAAAGGGIDQELERSSHGTSTPGLSTPVGSRSALTARSTDAPSSRIWGTSHGLWSVPTAWWWVMVAPAATIASLAAALAASHWATASSPGPACLAATVKYSEQPVS